MDFLQKIDFLMKRDGLNKNSLSAKSGIPYTTIVGMYTKGYQNVKLTTIKRLATAFDTTLDYLIRDDVMDPNYGKADGFTVDYYEMTLIEKYRDIDPRGQMIVNAVLEAEYSFCRGGESVRPAPVGGESVKVIDIPLPTQSASAGNGDYIDDDSAEMVQVKYNKETAKADYLMRINGDSMEPLISDGDLVLVRRQPAVDDGQIGIFFVDGERYIKRYRGTYLESINRKRENVALTEDTVCVGLVIGKLEDAWRV